MFLSISSVLNAEKLERVKLLADDLEFRDGKATAGWHAREVKANRQAAPGPALRQIQRLLTDALRSHEVVRAAALPLRIVPPLLSRYAQKEHYGNHVDDALMMTDPPTRSDLSVTVFLSDPASYAGGELVIVSPAGEEAIKLGAGDAVVYPSTTIHRVEPVTDGERFVAVTWIQSLVRDAALREILFDLDRARRQVFEREGKGAPFDLIAKAYANLLRHAAEP